MTNRSQKSGQRTAICHLFAQVSPHLGIPEKRQQQPENKNCRSAEGYRFVITTHQHVLRKMVHPVRPGLDTPTVHLILSRFIMSFRAFLPLLISRGSLCISNSTRRAGARKRGYDHWLNELPESVD